VVGRRSALTCWFVLVVSCCVLTRLVVRRPGDGLILVSPSWHDHPWGGRRDPAINRCRQVGDRTARRGHAAFAGWCLSAARCCSLRSKLRSPSGSLAPCRDDRGESPLDPQRLAAQPREVYCAGQRWLQGPGSSGWWGTVAVLVSCHRPCVVAHFGWRRLGQRTGTGTPHHFGGLPVTASASDPGSCRLWSGS
jgi:hypothetical protein